VHASDYGSDDRSDSELRRRRGSKTSPSVALPARSDAYAVVQVNDAALEPAFIEELEFCSDVV
jgi:hypothetical protein